MFMINTGKPAVYFLLKNKNSDWPRYRNYCSNQNSSQPVPTNQALPITAKIGRREAKSVQPMRLSYSISRPPIRNRHMQAKPYLNRFPLELESRGNKATVRGPELQAEVHLHNHSVTRMEISIVVDSEFFPGSGIICSGPWAGKNEGAGK